MKLSIIIPCYNFEDYIEMSILSALSQKTNFDFEVLVADDNSTDKSMDSIVRFNETIKIVESNENLGASRNIKRLIENCRGQYIAYLDGDDYWTDIHKCQKQVDFLENNPDYSMTCTGFWIKNGDGFMQRVNSWHRIPDHYQNLEINTEQLTISHAAMFGRVFRNIPNLIRDWMLDFRFFDWVTNYELSKFGKIKCLNYPSGVYRDHGKGELTSMNQEDVKIECIKTSDYLKKEYKEWIINKSI